MSGLLAVVSEHRRRWAVEPCEKGWQLRAAALFGYTADDEVRFENPGGVFRTQDEAQTRADKLLVDALLTALRRPTAATRRAGNKAKSRGKSAAEILDAMLQQARHELEAGT